LAEPLRNAQLRRNAVAHVVALLVAAGPGFAAGADDDPVDGDKRIANGWRVLRTVDCARCHGKDYTGLAAPSIVSYAASVNRETFIRTVLDGDPPRGMPGYRANSYVTDNFDDIYRYFQARAAGYVGPDYRPPRSTEQR
jgi:mono/diheme cytochrome c family protein